MEVTEDTTLGELLKHPEAVKVLIKYRVPCLGCPLARFELGRLKIGDIAKFYGLDLENLLRELNEVLKEVER